MVFNSSSLSFTQSSSSHSHSNHSQSANANNKENSSTRSTQSSNGKMPTPTTPFSPHHQQTPLPPPSTSTTTNYVSHYTRPVRQQPTTPNTAASAEPTMTQLLANQPTSIAHYSRRNQGGDGDATMGNATGLLSWRKGQGFKEWEKVKLNSMEVKRKADVAQLCQSRIPPWSLNML